MVYQIFLAKESRAGEHRVALIPQDIAILIEKGHGVTVESNAGLGAGYENKAYQAVGASIVNLAESELCSYTEAFKNIDLIVRAKRPNREREQLECQAFQTGTMMLGAFDPLEGDSDHVNEYHRAGIQAYSIDQANLPSTDPMNVLAAMGRFAGKLALNDAISKCINPVNKVVIIGLGEVGRSALAEAIKLTLPASVILGDEARVLALEKSGVNAYVVDRSLSLEEQQQKIAAIISDADIVITTARKAGQSAPLLIPTASLDAMKSHAVIVDMAISEGGNVYGSKHDETIKTDRNVLITNVSGYPKAMPHEASSLWSKASLHWILGLAAEPSLIAFKPC